MISKLLSFILILFLLSPFPASAGMDEGKEMVKDALKETPVNNNLHWSGITWDVPATHSNTWVDDQNNLHMKLEKINDRWCGAILESRNTVKYGKFTWVISSSSLNLERNTTIGLFIYHDDRNELDIEINQWPGTDQHLYFVNQPGSIEDHPENISYGVFSSNPHLNDKNIVYSIEWTPDYVYYSATAEDGTIILDWTYSNPEGIPAINSTICMDILPLAGRYYPASGNAAEIVLSSFTYTPYDSSWTEPKQKPVASAVPEKGVIVTASTSRDEGKEMVKDAIKETPQEWADEALSQNWGVKLGSLPEEVSASPSAKLINGIAAAEQHPESLQWVQEERERDYMTYVLCGLIILVWIAGYFFLQKFKPEEAGKVTKFFSGAEHFIGFGLYYKTLILLILLPSILPYLLDYSIELEQAWSSGIMQDSLEYISFSTENIPLYFYQGMSYLLSGGFFLGRIELINIIYAKVLFVAIAIAIPWSFIRYLGLGTLLFFETVLFMRPIVLLLNAKTVQHVAEMSPAQALIAAPPFYGTMMIVTLVIVIIGTLWPLIYVVYLLWTSRPGRYVRRTARGY
jgi:hypothetical protein